MEEGENPSFWRQCERRRMGERKGHPKSRSRSWRQYSSILMLARHTARPAADGRCHDSAFNQHLLPIETTMSFCLFPFCEKFLIAIALFFYNLSRPLRALTLPSTNPPPCCCWLLPSSPLPSNLKGRKSSLSFYLSHQRLFFLTCFISRTSYFHCPPHVTYPHST